MQYRKSFFVADRIVVKVGVSVLTTDCGDFDQCRIYRIAAAISELCKSGAKVVVVTSGAVATGRDAIVASRPLRTIFDEQAAAAVGQIRLMQAYETAFSSLGQRVAQILITRDDICNRKRFINARTTIEMLLSKDVIPVVNENQSVMTEDTKFCDNDELPVSITNLVEADLLMILTDVDGLSKWDRDARLIPFVRHIPKKMIEVAAGRGSESGMLSKFAAVKKAWLCGIPTLILNGRTPINLVEILSGQNSGTLFLPGKSSMNRRKHWITCTLQPRGVICVDAGAKFAIEKFGKSLLPSGIMQVSGNFDRGSCVKVCGFGESEFACGITQYSQTEIEKLVGRNSKEIKTILGYNSGNAVIHRNNLVLVES